MNAFQAIERLFTETVVERLGWVLVHSLWQFALVALLAGVIVRRMRRSSAATRYGMLAVAMAVSVTAPVATWMLQPGDAPPDHSVNRVALAPGHGANAAISPEADATRLASVPILASDPEREVPTPDHAVPSVASEALPVVSPSVPAIVQSAPSWSERATTVLRPWLAWIVVGWSLGVAMCSLRPLLGWHTLRRLQRVGVSSASDEVLSTMRRVSERLGLRCAVRVLQSTLAQVPVVIGYMRPVILLPVCLMTSIPAAQLEAILAHELAHVRRHDFVVNLLQTLVETLFFYHPAVWWLSHQIRVEREHCCDDLVVELLGNRVEYGRALVAVEELRGRSTVLALGVADGSLLARVRRLVRVGSDRDVDSQSTAARLSDRWPFALLSLAFLGVAFALSMSWTLAAKDDATKELQPTIAKLPGDVTVELIGVGFHPSKDRGWWKADGSKLEQPPTLKSRFAVIPNSTERDQNREFVVQIRGLSNEPSAITVYEVSNASAYSLTDGLWVGESRAGPFKSKTTSIRVGLTTEPYGPTVSINATGEKQAVAEMSEELQKFYALISPLGVQEIDEQTELLLAGIPYDALHKSAVWELHAIDVDGQKHRSSSESTPVTGEKHVAFKLPLSRIARFEYRLRPYQHWVTFKNVSLHPGQKTDVTTTVVSIPGEKLKPDKYMASLPNGVEVELAGVAFANAVGPDGSRRRKEEAWWRADGTKLDAPPFKLFSVLMGTNAAAFREFAIRLTPPGGRSLITANHLRWSPCPNPGIGGVEGWDMDGLGSRYQVQSTAGFDDEKPITVHVIVSDQPLGPAWLIGLDGKPLPQNPADATTTALRKFIQIVRVEDFQTGTTLRYKLHSDFEDWTEWEVRAIDKKGEGHLDFDGKGPDARAARTTNDGDGRTFQLPSTDTSHFEIRLRPMTHKVTFENVSLVPGQKTEVKVSVASLKPPMPDQTVAKLPHGLKVEFIGITKNTAPAKDGWKPDGLPLGDDVGYWPSTTVLHNKNTSASYVENGPHPEPDAEAMDLLFRFRGLKAQPSITFDLAPNGTSHPLLPVKDPYELRVSTRRRGEHPPGGAMDDSRWRDAHRADR